MNNIQKRFLLFIFGCIFVRTIFVVVAKKINKKYLPYLGYLALFVGISFLNIYFFKPRSTGVEVFGDKIWWNDIRIVHGFLYILFAVYAIKKESFAYIPLLIDVIFGLVMFLLYHYKMGNFSKL